MHSLIEKGNEEDILDIPFDLKVKIDVLLARGYTFKFLNAGDAYIPSGPTVIDVQYELPDVNFMELIDASFKKNRKYDN